MRVTSVMTAVMMNTSLMFKKVVAKKKTATSMVMSIQTRQSLKSKYAKKRCTWQKVDFEQQARTFEDNFPLPSAEPLPAKEYFGMFVSRSMLKYVVEGTDEYCVQKNGMPLNLTEELMSVMGTFFRMGLVDMHRVKAYWENSSPYELLVQAMLTNWFENITSHLHFTDNDSATTETKEDRLWKLHPLLSLQRDMMNVSQEKKSCG